MTEVKVKPANLCLFKTGNDHLAGREETKPFVFEEMTAQDRFALLLATPEPSKKLIELCSHFEPGTIFNQEGINELPSVLLIGAYEPADLPAGRFNAPPFGLQRLASFLRAGGIKADIFDVTTRGEEELLKLVRAKKYDYVGFSMLGPTLPYDIQLTHKIKNLSPDSFLVAGGAVPTARPDLLKQSAADSLIVGYGERPLLDLIVARTRKRKIDQIPGVWLRKNNGYSGKWAEPVSALDLKTYLFLFDPTIGFKENYPQPDGLYNAGVEKARLNVSRFIGQAFCPRGCSFCSTRNFLRSATGGEQKYLSLDPADRFKVIANIAEKLRVSTIYLNDDDLFTKKREAIEFFKLVSKAKENNSFPADIKFICSSRIDEIDNELLTWAHKAGVILINIGVESFHYEGLSSLGKGLRITDCEDQATAAVILSRLKQIKDAGIIPSANLIIFYPDVEWSHIYTTLKQATKMLLFGGEVNMTTYIRLYYGADILKDEAIPRLRYGEPIIPAVGADSDFFLHETVLLPKDKKMRAFAKKVIIRRSRLEEACKRRFAWRHRRAPHMVVQACFIQALILEAVELDLTSLKVNTSILAEIDDLINREFRKAGASPDSEKQAESEIFLSLPLKQREAAFKLKESLESTGVSKALIQNLLALRTALFCDAWDLPNIQKIKPYLRYLFFGEEKSRFFHLDELDRYIVVNSLLLNLNLTREQKNAVLQSFEVPDLTPDLRKKLMTYLRNDIWFGPDEQKEVSLMVRELIAELLTGN